MDVTRDNSRTCKISHKIWVKGMLGQPAMGVRHICSMLSTYVSSVHEFVTLVSDTGDVLLWVLVHNSTCPVLGQSKTCMQHPIAPQ